MGADTFVTAWHNLKSRDYGSIREAFDSAVEAAQYDYGHAGYTGTIAEKDGFVICGQADSLDSARDMADELIKKDDPRISDKWGPAGAITYKAGDGYGVVFFGWASC